MTGDGVNDSPALKKADVGFAMGSGTEVAKEAGDITILDDNFLSIEKAILYGRTMFKSIRKFLIFQLTVNVAAVLTCFLAPLFGENEILTVIQLLVVNLAMDTLAAIAFGSEPALMEYMKEKPIARDASIVTGKMMSQVVVSGLYITAMCLCIRFVPALQHLLGAWSTGVLDTTLLNSAVFATFMMAISFNGFNARTEHTNPFEHLERNKNFLLVIGALLVLVFVVVMLFTNSYRLIEKWIIAFVSIIGLSFIYELSLVTIDWPQAARAWVTPSFPEGSMVIIMSVLGAVVMPHNLFLHSEVIQSRQWNLSDDAVIRRQLRYEYADTIFSMLVGWAINSAMILLAAATFFVTKTPVEELQQADSLLQPLLGRSATHIFAVALLFAGISSTITSGMAAGSIFAGIFKEPYNIRDNHSRTGVMVSLVVAFLIILLIGDPFKGLIYSQMILSIQLPFTVFLQVHLTSSERVMGKYRNSRFTKYLLYGIGAVVTVLNVMLLVSFFR